MQCSLFNLFRLRLPRKLCWGWSALNAKFASRFLSSAASISSLVETRRGRDRWFSSRFLSFLLANTKHHLASMKGLNRSFLTVPFFKPKFYSSKIRLLFNQTVTQAKCKVSCWLSFLQQYDKLMIFILASRYILISTFLFLFFPSKLVTPPNERNVY